MPSIQPIMIIEVSWLRGITIMPLNIDVTAPEINAAKSETWICIWLSLFLGRAEYVVLIQWYVPATKIKINMKAAGIPHSVAICMIEL